MTDLCALVADRKGEMVRFKTCPDLCVHLCTKKSPGSCAYANRFIIDNRTVVECTYYPTNYKPYKSK